MKKIFFLVMLSILTVANVTAAEHILWEGDYNVSWNLPNGDANREWGGAEGQNVTSHFVAGAKIFIYLTVVADAEYHKCQFDNWEWEALPGIAPIEFTQDTRVTIDVTEAIASAVAEKGFRLHGHGFHVTKVTKQVDNSTAISDLAPAVLWQGYKDLSDYAPDSGLKLNLKELGITQECNFYLLVEKAGDLRITRNSNGWVDWPAAEHNHCTGNIDANNITKVELPQDFVTTVTEGEGEGYWHEIVLWGNGLTIKAIATTKETLLSSLTTDANGYATYSSNYTLALDRLPSGLKAHTALLEGTTLKFNEKTTATGAGTGLLLKGETNTTYYIPAKSDNTAPDYNALSANLTEQTLKSTDENHIFIMKKATETGALTFKRLSDIGANIPANKAYVVVAASAFGSNARELSILFDDETTTIHTLEHTVDISNSNHIYNLSGQRVEQPTKGIYIINGKKIIVN